MRVHAVAIGISYLNFVNAAQIDAAILVFIDSHHDVDIEIFELLVSAEISIILVWLALLLCGIVDEQSILDTPAIHGFRIGEPPTSQIGSVEEINRRPELHLAQ